MQIETKIRYSKIPNKMTLTKKIKKPNTKCWYNVGQLELWHSADRN